MNSHNGQIYMMQKGSKTQILNAFLPILLSCNSKHMFIGLFWGTTELLSAQMEVLYYN